MPTEAPRSLWKRRWLLAVLLCVAAVFGFLFGRAGGNFIAAPESNVNYPAPPPPPKPSPAPKPKPEAEKNIIVEVPVEGAVLPESFSVAGRARVYENTVNIEVKDAAGKILLQTFTTGTGETGEFGRFEAQILIPDLKPGAGTVEVYWIDASDGSTRDRVIRNVIFAPGDVLPVKIFFGNGDLDPANTCDTTFAVTRFVSREGSVYRAALEELLKGPTAAEKERGYFTSLPPKVKIKSVVNDAEGTVTADFNAELNKVAGSCRVIAIRDQITETLKQFPEVRDVVISVDGNTEEVLQP